MFILKGFPHSIKIYPAVIVPTINKQQRLSYIARKIYNYLWNGATFTNSKKKPSSLFVTFQRIAYSLRYKMPTVAKYIHELIRSNRLEQHKDGYLILVKEGAV